MVEKKGLSPVIATVLLVGIVIVIGLIVFLWFRGIIEEKVTKFDNQNVKIVCGEVVFDATFSSGSIYVKNTGNVPIYKMKAKVSGQGSHSIEFVGGDGSWPEFGLNQGGSYSGSVSYSGDSLLLIPVLLGRSESGDKSYTCEERHGFELSI